MRTTWTLNAQPGVPERECLEPSQALHQSFVMGIKMTQPKSLEDYGVTLNRGQWLPSGTEASNMHDIAKAQKYAGIYSRRLDKF